MSIQVGCRCMLEHELSALEADPQHALTPLFPPPGIDPDRQQC